VERQDSGATITAVGRISIEHVATALRRVQSMDEPQKLKLLEAIKVKQPNLLASCIVQSRLGANEQTVQFLLNILLVCFLAMHESGYDWPLITDDEQERQLGRMVGAVRFSEDLHDPLAAASARDQYVAGHPEQPLLAMVLSQCNEWLRDLAHQKTEKDSDKFVMMASMNLVNCIAHAEAQRRRAL
jgi:hypothetical protein